MQIRLENLKRDYEDLHAVKDVSLVIPENCIFGVIGRSGAGKSTLVRLMSLLEKPDCGKIFYDEREVQNLEKDELIQQRRKIGMIFQNFNLFTSRTAGGNVAYPLQICRVPREQIKKRVLELMKLVGLEDKIDAPISSLSGGQKQRVAIARALANNPEVLFCDEATSALDPQTTRSILALIKDIQKKMGLTVVMITHQMEVVRDACDLVAVLDSGEVVEQGEVGEIFSRPKTAVTKDFLSHLTSAAQTKESGMVNFSGKDGRYTLRFRGDSTGEPVLSRMTQQFGVEVNILAAGVQTVNGEKVGTMVCDFIGSDEAREKALEYLEKNNVFAEDGNERNSD